MIRATFETETVVVAQSGAEFDTLGEAVQPFDRDLATKLRGFARLVHDYSVGPESTCFRGATAVHLLEALEDLRQRSASMRAGHAALMLADANVLMLTERDWLDGDPVAIIQGLTEEGPHSADIILSTGSFRPEAEWLCEARLMPVEIG